jgi:hypothetical protein
MSNHMTVRNRFAESFTALLVAFFSFALNARAAIPPAEKILPDDTLFVIGTPDFSKLAAAYKASPQRQLWDDPAMKPFREKYMSKLSEELITPLERELGVKFDDFSSLPQGQVTFAITQDGWDGLREHSPAKLFLLDAKEKSNQLKTNLAEFRRKWVDSGKTIKTEKIRDLEFTSYLLSDNDVPKALKKIFGPGSPDETEEGSAPSHKNELIVGQFETLFIAGNSTKAIEKIVAHLTGSDAPSLADVPAFEANRAAMFRDAPIYGWANAKMFLDIFFNQAGANDPETENPLAFLNPEKIIPTIGFSSLKTLAFTVQNSPEGLLAHFFATAPESSRQGIFKLIPPDGKESSPPPFVPADAVSFRRSRIDGQRAWATLQKILNDLSPDIMKGINSALDLANSVGKDKDPSFDIKKNLFGNLGDDMITYEKAPRGNSVAELNSPPSLFLIGSPHPDELASALKNLLILLNPQGRPPAEREFLGRKIYSMPLPTLALAAAGAKPSNRNLNYAFTSSYVALSSDIAMLEEYLRSSDTPKKSLRETEGLVDAAQRIGGSSVGVFGYENSVESSRAQFELDKKNASAGFGEAVAPPGLDLPLIGNPLKQWMDYSVLPPFEQIAKYYSFKVYGLSANAEGITLKIFTPTPPQLRK